MARREYKYELNNNLAKHLRIKQARISIERNNSITLQDLYNEMATYMGVSTNTVALIKAGNYNPSLIVAMAMAEYLETTVNELFTITPKKQTPDEGVTK